MSTAVQDIMNRIAALSDEDRAALEEALTDQLEQRWREEAAKVRQQAAARGIDDDAIARAVEEQRYSR